MDGTEAEERRGRGMAAGNVVRIRDKFESSLRWGVGREGKREGKRERGEVLKIYTSAGVFVLSRCLLIYRGPRI